MKLGQLEVSVLFTRRVLKPDRSELPDIDLTALSSTKNTIFTEHVPVAAFA